MVGIGCLQYCSLSLAIYWRDHKNMQITDLKKKIYEKALVALNSFWTMVMWMEEHMFVFTTPAT